MMRLLPVGLACAVLAWAPPQVHAWNSIGHMAVAKLAYDRLSDSQKTKLFTLLQSHPHYEKFLAAGRPCDVSEVEWAIVRSAIWPDWVRPRTKDDRGLGVTKFHRGEDHYINVPFIDPKDQDVFAGKTVVDPDLANVVSALKERCTELRTKTADPADRAVAICWIFHLIGDIHQPLHNVAYFSDTKEYNRGDQGGNLFGVRAAGRKTKLHAYWDDLLGIDSNYGDDSAQHQIEIYQEALKVAASLRNLQLADADQTKLSQNTTFLSWSKESFELAKSVGYQKSDGSGILEGVLVPFKGPIPDAAPEVGDDYIKTARATAESRVVMAGQRLAERLKAVIGK
jgi:S1/P1 Nuclease